MGGVERGVVVEATAALDMGVLPLGRQRFGPGPDILLWCRLEHLAAFPCSSIICSQLHLDVIRFSGCAFRFG